MSAVNGAVLRCDRMGSCYRADFVLVCCVCVCVITVTH